MAVRTFVTAGVAFAAAGAVAATVVLAPPMSPRDVQVAKSTEVSLNAVVTDPALTQLINSYFNSGAAAVVQDLLLGIVGDGAPADLINGYFDTGLSEVVRQILVAANPTNTVGNSAINIFFNGDNPLATADEEGVSGNPALFGASGLVYARLFAAAASGDLTPDQWEVIDGFFQGGLTQVTEAQLLDHFQAPVQQQFITDLFDGGATQLAYRQIGGDFDDPSTTPFLSTFFNINNPFGALDDEGNNTGVTDNPALYGVSGVVYARLLAAGLAPEQQQVVSDFFQGGASQVVLDQLVSRAPDWATKSLINGFFTVGVSEVIRQILVGPPPEPVNTLARTFKAADLQENPAPVDPTPGDTELNAAAANLKPVDSDPAPVTEKKAKLATEPVQAVAAAPAAPAVASPPSVQTPAPATPVVVKTVDEDDTEGSNDVTDAMKTGNKVVVAPILITGANGRGPKPGEGSWGVFGQVADAIGKTIAGASAPKTSTGSTGAADGS
jgi:hypothetical protein